MEKVYYISINIHACLIDSQKTTIQEETIYELVFTWHSFVSVQLTEHVNKNWLSISGILCAKPEFRQK